MKKVKRIDWIAAQAAYVNDPTLTHAEIAVRFNTTAGTVRARAFREKWKEARQIRTTFVQQSANKKSITATAQELAKYNEQDLMTAKALRTMAARRLRAADEDKELISAKDLRSLAGAVESAQRIARLALGAATENTMTGEPYDPLMSEINLESLNDDELAAFQQLLVKAISNARRGSETPSSSTVQ